MRPKTWVMIFRLKDLNQSYLLYSNNMLYDKEKTMTSKMPYKDYQNTKKKNL